MKAMGMLLIAAVTMMAVAPPSEAELRCSQVVSSLRPCILYLKNKGPLGSCCDGFKGLFSAAQTTPARQTVCGCLKSVAGSVPSLADLPAQCGISLPYKISPSTNCTTVRQPTWSAVI